MAAVTVSATGADAKEPVQTSGSVAEVTVDAEGTTVLHLGAIDSTGNQEPQQTVTIRIDRVPPEVSPLVTPAPNDRGWHRGDVTVSLQGVDQQSGVAECDGPFLLNGEGTNFSITGGCTDVAGNVSTAIEVSGINIDRTPPTISAPAPVRLDTGPEGLPATAPELAAFLAGAVAADALDAAPVITHDAPALFALGTTTVTFTATDAAGNASTTSATVTLKATPVIAWTAPDAIVFGTPLGDGELDAATSVGGSFAYSPAAGTVLNAGAHTLSVTFHPDDTDRYNDAAASVAITVRKATPVIQWPAPAAIVYGTALGASQLNATANVSGTFAYTPGHGSILNAGDHPLSVHFTPADGSNYNDASDGVALIVRQAPLTVTADNQSMIVNGTMPPLTVSYSGFVNGDTPASLDTPVSIATEATGAAAGAFPIQASAARDGNYTIAFVDGTLSVLYSTGPCLGGAGHAVLPPLAADGTSVFRANRTVPIKFRVCDANGVSIGTPGVVSSFQLVQQLAGTVATPVDETVDSTTPNDAFRWDPDDAQWIFNLRTEGLAANITYLYRITLNDGSAFEVRFGLR